jgi:hypothetical protein
VRIKLLRVLLEKIDRRDDVNSDISRNVLATKLADREPAIIIERNQPFHVSTAPKLKSVPSDLDTLHSLRDWHNEKTHDIRSFGTNREPTFSHPVPQAKRESIQVGQATRTTMFSSQLTQSFDFDRVGASCTVCDTRASRKWPGPNFC